MSQKSVFLQSEGDAYFDRNEKDADCSAVPYTFDSHERMSADVLRKDSAAAFIRNPYR